MRDRCAACGRPIVAVHQVGPPVSLTYVWRHHSWWANRSHAAIPESAVQTGDE